MNTQYVRITKQFTFDMAHALSGYDGPCKNIHGHTYKLSVTLKGKPLINTNHPKTGMLIDFTEFKKMVKTHVIDIFDHSLVLNKKSPHALLGELKDNFEKVNYVPYQPTCELLLIDIKEKIAAHLPGQATLHSIKLEETHSSFAEWFATDNTQE